MPARLFVLIAMLIPAFRLLAAESEQGQHFDVLEFRVLGNTLLDAAAIETSVYPFLGPGKDIAQVEAARRALETVYRNRGFGTVYVDIPEQSVDSGIVRLQVTEGKLRRVVVQGARYFSGRQILAKLPAAAQGVSPSLPDLQAELAALNIETRDRRVTPVLAAGTLPGTVDLKLNVDDDLPLHASVEVNDRYTADTSRLRTTIGVSYDNLFNRLDSIGLQYQTSPSERQELGVFVASYTARLDERNRLSFLFVDSDSNVAALGTLAVLGKGRIYSAHWQRQLQNTAEATHSLVVGLDYKDFRETIRLEQDKNFNTPISYLNASIGHVSIWRQPTAQWQLATSINFGPRSFVNGEGEFADKRFKGRPNYFYLRSDASVRWNLPKGFSMRMSLGGQYAVEPLIANEQFAIGGADGVRGYLEAEEIADIGLKSSLELGLPPLRLFSNALVVEGYGFTDAGRVSTIEPLPGEDRNANLWSVGLGMNFSVLDHVAGQLQWAMPRMTGSHTESGDSRFHFSLRSSW